MTNKKAKFTVGKSSRKPWLGLLEWWSIGVLKKRHQSFRHHSNTPVLQCSEIVEIERSHEGILFIVVPKKILGADPI
jgi:hypothetical protein